MANIALAVQPKSSTRTIVNFPTSRSIFDDFDAITNEIAQRAFGIFATRGTDGQDLNDWLRAESELLKPVPFELSENDTSYTIRADVPGFSQTELSVQAQSNSVFIEGKKEETRKEKDGTKVRYSEVTASQLCRRIDLPASINPEKVSATLTNGVLELTVPKAAPPKSVEIKAA